jgi:hypothetical protein
LELESSADVIIALIDAISKANISTEFIRVALEKRLKEQATREVATSAITRLELTNSSTALSALASSRTTGLGTALSVARLGSRDSVARLVDDNSGRRYSDWIVQNLEPLGAQEAIPLALDALGHDSDPICRTSQCVLPLLRSDRNVGNLLSLNDLGYEGAADELKYGVSNPLSQDSYGGRLGASVEFGDLLDLADRFGPIPAMVAGAQSALENRLVERRAPTILAWDRLRANGSSPDHDEPGSNTKSASTVALDVIDRFGDEKAYPGLESLLDNHGARVMVAELLARRNPRPELRTKVLKILTDAPPAEEGSDETNHLTALSWLDPKLARERATFSSDPALRLALEASGAAEQWQRRLLLSDPSHARVEALMELADVLEKMPHTAHCQKLLTDLLGSAEPAVRASALRAARAGHYGELASQIKPLLDDDRFSVRRLAFDALKSFGQVEGFEAALAIALNKKALLPLRVSALRAFPTLGRNPAWRDRLWDALVSVARDDEHDLGFVAFDVMSRLTRVAPIPPKALEFLTRALEEHHLRYAKFRQVRDRDVDESAADEVRKKHRDDLQAVAPPIGLTHGLAFALCSGDPSQALGLLADDLYEVRDAAAAYLTLHASVATLQQVDHWRAKQQQHSARAAAYTAIDYRLFVLQGLGTEADAAALDRWQKNASDQVLSERIAWVAAGIRDRLKWSPPS